MHFHVVRRHHQRRFFEGLARFFEGLAWSYCRARLIVESDSLEHPLKRYYPQSDKRLGFAPSPEHYVERSAGPSEFHPGD